jgi:hypothetical protein
MALLEQPPGQVAVAMAAAAQATRAFPLLVMAATITSEPAEALEQARPELMAAVGAAVIVRSSFMVALAATG